MSLKLRRCSALCLCLCVLASADHLMDIFGTLDTNGDHVIDENEWKHGAPSLAMSTFAGTCQTAQCDSRNDQARASVDQGNLMQVGASVLAVGQDAAKTGVHELEHNVAVLQGKLRVCQEQAASCRGRGASQLEGGGTVGKTDVEKGVNCANPSALPVMYSQEAHSYDGDPNECSLEATPRCPYHYCKPYHYPDMLTAHSDAVDMSYERGYTLECFYRVPAKRVYDWLPLWTIYTCLPVLPPVRPATWNGWSGGQLSFYCPDGKGTQSIGVRGEIIGPQEKIWDSFAHFPKRLLPPPATRKVCKADGAKRMSSAGQPVQDYQVCVFSPEGFFEFHPPVTNTHSLATFQIDMTWTFDEELGCSCGFCDDNPER